MANKKSKFTKATEEEFMTETEASKDFLNFFLTGLKDIYWCEQHIQKWFAAKIKLCNHVTLNDSLSEQLSAAKERVEILEHVYEILGEAARAKKSEAMAGLMEEANQAIQELKKGSSLKHAAILLSAQKTNQYQMASYEAMVQLARKMGNEDIIKLLEDNLASINKGVDSLAGLTEEIIPVSTGKSKESFLSNNSEDAGVVYDSINLTEKISGK